MSQKQVRCLTDNADEQKNKSPTSDQKPCFISSLRCLLSSHPRSAHPAHRATCRHCEALICAFSAVQASFWRLSLLTVPRFARPYLPSDYLLPLPLILPTKKLLTPRASWESFSSSSNTQSLRPFGGTLPPATLNSCLPYHRFRLHLQTPPLPHRNASSGPPRSACARRQLSRLLSRCAQRSTWRNLSLQRSGLT